MKYLIVLLLLIGCTDNETVMNKFGTLKEECQQLAKKLNTEYDIHGNLEQSKCWIVDTRVDYRYSIGNIDATIGASRALEIQEKLKTNIEFHNCVEIKCAKTCDSEYTTHKTYSECAKQFNREY